MHVQDPVLEIRVFYGLGFSNNFLYLEEASVERLPTDLRLFDHRRIFRLKPTGFASNMAISHIPLRMPEESYRLHLIRKNEI